MMRVIGLFVLLIDCFPLAEDSDEKTEEKVTMQDELEMLRLAVNALNERVDSCSKTVVELNKRIDASTKTMSTFHKKIDLSAKTISGMNRRVDSCAKSVKTLNKTVTMCSKNVEAFGEKINSLSEYCRTLPEGSCGVCQCKDDYRLLNKHYCDCQNLPPLRDCLKFLNDGRKVNGIYKIHQNNLRIIQVYCDQTTDGGGWTVFQRRTDGSAKFYRDWLSYKKGFGELQNEFWLGNANLFTVSLQGLYPSANELRIDLEDWEGKKRYAKYSTFQVGNEMTRYQINLGGYAGDAGDGGQGMSFANGLKFSTYDYDNDLSPGNCAIAYLGGWWYANCHAVSLNGKYYDYAKMGKWATGIHWLPFHGLDYSLKRVEMKIRRKT